MIRAVRSIVHEKASPREALDLFHSLAEGGRAPGKGGSVR
jgi:hypothetical protein